MSDPQTPRGGELNAAITREVIRVQNASLGRGPKKAFSFYNGNTVVTIMQDVMTRAEQRLAANGDGEAVLEMRRLYQRSMAEDLTDAVEAVTGRTVTAFLSDNHLDPDLAIEVFVLDQPLD